MRRIWSHYSILCFCIIIFNFYYQKIMQCSVEISSRKKCDFNYVMGNWCLFACFQKLFHWIVFEPKTSSTKTIPNGYLFYITKALPRNCAVAAVSHHWHLLDKPCILCSEVVFFVDSKLEQILCGKFLCRVFSFSEKIKQQKLTRFSIIWTWISVPF